MADAAHQVEIFEKMIAIRRFEETVFSLHEEGAFGGHYQIGRA